MPIVSLSFPVGLSTYDIAIRMRETLGLDNAIYVKYEL